jgi:hypothetical protein
MANKKINSVKLLPEIFRTDRNSKFLSSTIDQLIQPAQLERLDAYVGSTQTPTYKTSDVYLTGSKPYQLSPALITNDNVGNITGTQGYTDLINQVGIKGGYVNDLDRLFRSKVYSYNAHIDWDKLVNYQNYYWLPTGPATIEVTTNDLNVDTDIIGEPTADVQSGNKTVTLSNGMVISFVGLDISDTYSFKEFFVEGVGTAIKLVPLEKLLVSENFINTYVDGFDANAFDSLPFDNSRELPIIAEYVTINRASKDLNAWSRYNRWVHQDVIKKSAEVNEIVALYPTDARAQRPIIEFKADIQLFNFGTQGIQPVDLLDVLMEDPFATVDGSTSDVYIDNVLLEQGHRVIFASATDENVRGNIYEATFEIAGNTRTLRLIPTYDSVPVDGNTVAILLGKEYNSTDWWYSVDSWKIAQQRITINQAPLFNLYDIDGYGFSDTTYYLSNFAGNKIFSYKVGTGTNDKYLGFPLDYRSTDAIGGIKFSNDLVIDVITISQIGQPTYQISTNTAYIKIDNSYENAWVETVEYPMPLLTSTATSIDSYYQEPLSLTNNPLNGSIAEFTISELSEHLQSMITRGIPGYNVSLSNLRDLPDYTNYGIKLISNANPIAFAQMFIGKKEHSVIDALDKVADQYGHFKLTFLNSVNNFDNQGNPVAAVDQILTDLNQNKTLLSPYYLSDMTGYGNPEITRTWTVTNINNTSYPLNSGFDMSTLSTRSVLVYLNGEQLVYGIDYEFDVVLATVEISRPLTIDDVLLVNDYTDTEGAYIPPTPSKLGLYPKFVPSIYVDDTYTIPTKVIQGHDGSIMIAYDDYRDSIILELEKRIYNNIKASYREELLDINSILPGAFRTTNYSLDEINEIIKSDLAKWSAKFNVDYTANNLFDAYESKTWNFAGSEISELDLKTNGSWRAIYKYLYDTDRPHSHPWEMLGYSIRPTWWESTYGAGPYLPSNSMWTDIEEGYDTGSLSYLQNYSRPGLIDILPVDNAGALRAPDEIISNISEYTKRQSWVAGDQGPAEAAWRRSSYYPYVIQKLLALTVPATYASSMYDPSRVQKNISGQWTYGTNETFFQLTNLFVFGENKTLTSGYSVLISEVGQQRSSKYVNELRQDLEFANYNLFFKVGGFVDQDTLQIIIDSYDPSSTAPGAILPSRNYKLRLNVGNPIQTVSASGIIIQKLNGEYIVKGYDRKNSYFTCLQPIRNLNTSAITVGGVSAKYVVWESSGTAGATGLSATDTTTASSAPTGNFYQKGQYVYYGSNFYKCTVAHRASATFNPTYFQILPGLPTVGGATVQTAGSFSNKETVVPYGTAYTNIQDVYDFIIGYGQWLTKQGFDFQSYSSDLETVIDWNLSSKEFLFWTTQNWKEGSIITLSPFADKLTFSSNIAIVDNLFDSYTEYSILKADGTPYIQTDLSITRTDSVCTISTLPDTDGIYFARLNCVQKEHAIIFDNKTIFDDVIYNLETGSRQRRVKLVGFRTANWNGDYFSPGFVYDEALVNNWTEFKDYLAGDVVRFGGKFYSAIKNVDGAAIFDFNKWSILSKKPTPGLLPNFDYKISQFEDFYSLDSDNFDEGQQKMAQHLIGYTPRPYLNNIFTDPVAQYKFYQGFIREKGTRNSIDKLSKASLNNLNGQITFNEEWAFRVGQYGSFPTYQELEVPLIEGTFLENPQVINFTTTEPPASANNLIHYSLPSDLTISPDNFNPVNTFASTTGNDSLVLAYAGYVRLDDVTATAYNENSLLDIANSNSLTDGDTIWLGFKQDGTWDIYRYTYYPVGVVGVYVSAPLSTITFVTDAPHGLQVGQLIGVSQFNTQVDGIYIVKEIPNTRQFTVASSLASIEDAALPAPGQLYVFASARLSEVDKVPADKNLYRLPVGTKFWIDPTETAGWEVYEKNDNYNFTEYQSRDLPAGQGLGKSISKRSGNNIIVVGAPNYNRAGQIGAVNVYRQELDGTLTDIFIYRLGVSGNSKFGSVVVYDDIAFTSSTFGLIFAGAPGINRVKISSINDRLLAEGTSTYISAPSNSIEEFGRSIFVERNASDKTVLVGSLGKVHSYTVSDNNGSIVVSSPVEVVDTTKTLTNSEWGYSISGADNASFIAVGAPAAGFVTVFNKSLTRIVTINSPFASNSRFGETVTMSPLGDYLFVGAPGVENTDASNGKVVVYINTNGTFVLDQILENPVKDDGMSFGKAISINSDTNTLVVSALGVNHTFPTTFDGGETSFDGGITYFTGTEVNSGAVYVYNRLNKRFILGQELTTDFIAVTSGTDYGTSVVVVDDTVLVGSPAQNNANIFSGFYKFDKINSNAFSWNKIRNQDPLVDVSTIQRVALINTVKDELVEYLDVIDPLKGKVAGIAEQELSYKLVSDPAIYSIGVAGTNNDTTKNWLDDHVGELWWDLSTAKYVWYEQSDLEYRRNNWGKLFPGATIDVYEWVGSSLLPTEWSSQADTPAGLAKGISGQPKYADNSAISVKQVYDTITNSFSNVYYYWVKNKVVVPDAKNRRISSYEVASIIADPSAYGLMYAAVIAKDSIALGNIGPQLVSSNISLNVAQNLFEESTVPPRHTEWLLMQENSASSMPTPMMEKKLIDSLLGHDSLGNLVPSPSLSERTRYGIGIRPQQTLFKDRLEALRNIVEFSNSVLMATPITGKYSFTNLNAQEEIPVRESNKYDSVVEDNSELETIDTTDFQLAVIECRVNSNGEVDNVRVVNPGFGYGTLNPVPDNFDNIIGYEGPTFKDVSYVYSTTFDNNTTSFDNGNTNFFEVDATNTYGRDLQINTLVDETGSIIDTQIITSGKGFISNFKFIARPQTVMVLSDDTYNGKWTQYEFDYETLEWTRAHTQSFNTQLYWNYEDWASENYNSYKIYTYVVGSPYELNELTLEEGQYVKINNGGDGRYVVVEKIADNVYGTFGKAFNLVYSQNGTIQISDGIWDTLNSGLGWDYINTYDSTLFDQTPDIELQYILKALKEDIFIDELKINWNLLFFKAVKYAFTEQKMIDWAFKTSFISVTNNAGELDQPPVYKLQDSSYYEDYINEVKPYKTQIRNFTTDYNVTEDSKTEVTDFDFPSYFNTVTNSFEIPTITNDDVLNNPVRRNSITLKFDRISTGNEIGDFNVVDTFVANGVDAEFVLNWVPDFDKSKAEVRVDGLLVLNDSFDVVHFTELFNGYYKKFGKIVFVKNIPEQGQVVTVNYQKDSGFLNAAERILSYYAPTVGMAGLDLGQLMTGITVPTTIDGQSSSIGFSNPFGGIYVDSFINGGTWSNGLPVGALGLHPEDMIVDGQYSFITPFSSPAPEEVVPGSVAESLGISVYTKGPSGAPIVISGAFDTGVSSSNQRFALPESPATIDSISVVCNGIILDYIDADILNADQFTIDWSTQELVIPPQAEIGKVGYTIIEVGGGSGTGFGLVDKGSFYTINASTVRIESLAEYGIVQDAFVTIDGIPVPRSTLVEDEICFVLYNDALDDRAFIKVFNMPAGEHLVQAWFFAESHEYFNEIRQQTAIVTTETTSLLLAFPPRDSKPWAAQTVVELTDTNGTRRLLPPSVNYYSIDNTGTSVFDISVPVSSPVTFNTSTVSVYKNGVQLSRTDYDCVAQTVVINTSTNPLVVGDTVAVETTGTNYYYDFRIDNGTGPDEILLHLSPGVVLEDSEIEVVTYSDHDSMLIQTEQFIGDSNRRFTISRPVLNDKYVWVTLFRESNDTYGMINGVDFVILEDNVTVQISDSWTIDSTDIISIMSINAPSPITNVVGYKIFKDILGGTTFTRLSVERTTYLTQPLYFTDTEIHVADATVLTGPNITENVPGVVFIAGERIEFFHSTETVLSQLSRSTMGTGPATYIRAGTKVVDQGAEQIIDAPLSIMIQNTFTNTLTNVYSISTATLDITDPNNGDSVRCDGITLTTILPDVELIDQVDIYYGGRKLRKNGMYVHDTTVTYDSIPVNNIVGSVASVEMLPDTTLIGNAYIVSATNKVWVYTGSRSASTATIGYVDSGVIYLEPEFTIEVDTGQTLTLNTTTVELVNNVQLTIVRTESSVTSSWNNIVTNTSTLSLIDSNTPVALFLKAAPAELPDDSYLGGDPRLTDENNEPLTTENGQYITGYY